MSSPLTRTLPRLLLLAALTPPGVVSGQATAGPIIPPTNPRTSLKQFVGPTEVELSFSRPSVKGRDVFGSLVPWNQVWRTGSDQATKISFSTDVTLNGARVPAGAYELFTIPGPSEWTVIIHQNKSQWGSYSYDPANDVARTSAQPVALRDRVESFNIGVTDLTTRSATLNIEWDHIRVPVTIEVDVAAIVVPRIEAAMQAEGRKPYFLAAMFYFENHLDINKAAEWINAAVAEQPNHIGILHRQALILAAKGDTAGALVAARRSLDGAKTSPRELKDEYTRLNNALIDKLSARRQR
jgi:hypothetical protein